MLGLAAVFAAAVLLAILELGPPTSSARTAKETITAANGVVQSTVTGTGNLEPGTDVEANFQTSGTLQHLYVKEGDHVSKGELIATLDRLLCLLLRALLLGDVPRDDDDPDDVVAAISQG